MKAAAGWGWLAFAACGMLRAEQPFASAVLEYAPAPGQFVNQPAYNDPARALGPPVGGGTVAPNNISVVTLGGFGGYVVLGFDHTVLDDPLNRFGMDAIVFSNAHWVGGDPRRHWAECVTIEISLDDNGNGLADDAWFLIPGSHLSPPDDQPVTVLWDDNVDNATYPPDDELWIPPGRHGLWSTTAFELPADVFATVIVESPAGDSTEGIFGYAEYTPTLLLGDRNGDNVVDDIASTPEEFYTIPDHPYRVGISRRSGGGDAFDIAWAVDPATGEPANLPGFDFIRLTTAVDLVSLLGETSGEIDAVADVAPDPTGDADLDGDLDLFDVAEFGNCFGEDYEAPCAVFDDDIDARLGLDDASAMFTRLTGPG